MRLIATTVVREAVFGKQESGFIYDIDWSLDRDAQRAVRRLPVPAPRFPSSDDNPRGGVRGGRGVAVTPRGIVVANHDTLTRYDDEWNVLDQIDHPLLLGTHEIDWDGGALWVSATAIDALLRVTLEGEVSVAWDPHADSVAGRFGLAPRRYPVDGTVDFRTGQAPPIDHCHLNGVTRRGSQTIVHLGLLRRRPTAAARFARRVARTAGLDVAGGHESVVVRLNGASADVLVRFAAGSLPTHNGQLIDDDRVAVNDSTSNTLRVFSAGDGCQLQEVPVPGTWLRGLEPLGGELLFVGSAPAAVHLIDLERGSIEQALVLSEDPNEAVHGLALASRVGKWS